MKRSELIRLLIRNGWYLDREGKHAIFRHPDRLDEIAVSRSSKELPTGTAAKILKLIGLE